MIYLQLFLAFLKVGLFSIGGGYAAIPVIQSQAVDRYAWIGLDEFTDLVSIAEITPGPITINAATFIGIKIAGIAGALIATAGFLIPSLVIVSIMFAIYNKIGKLKASQTVLSYIRPVVVALIASAGLTILINVIFGGSEISVAAVDWICAAIVAAAFVMIRLFKMNPIAVMASCGGVYTVLGLLLKL